ncbi:MAG: hypothetical protein ACTSQL_08700 [Promethearchaeota archaeon]
MSAMNVRAHPPINIDMEYDTNTEILSVQYTHGVSHPEVHYIITIEVWVNVTQVWEDHEHHQHYNDLDNYALAIRPTVAPDYIFFYTEQPTNITPITVSHTIARYYLPLPGLQQTGELRDNLPVDKNTGLEVPYLDKGRTNITLSATCSLGGVLTEHYYVGLPYYNPHLSFAEAAIPGAVSTIVVVALLFFLPKLGQKNAPKSKLEIKSKH